jgi:hypothetical protein
MHDVDNDDNDDNDKNDKNDKNDFIGWWYMKINEDMSKLMLIRFCLITADAIY